MSKDCINFFSRLDPKPNTPVFIYWAANAQRFKNEPLIRRKMNRLPSDRTSGRSKSLSWHGFLSPEKLVKEHLLYRYRMMFGSTTRADLCGTLEQNPKLSAADLARQCSCSYKAAYIAKRDFELLREKRVA
jgi:hypothetical protein